MSDLFLDNQKARERVRLGDADAPLNNQILPTGNADFVPSEGVQVAQAAPQGRKFLSATDVGYLSPLDAVNRASNASRSGFLSADQVGYVSPFRAQTNPDEQTTTPVKQESEGFFTGFGKALGGGFQDTAGSLFSAGATIAGANDAVVESSQAARERQKTEAQALGAFKQDIGQRKEADDSGLWAGIKNVAGAVYENPEGAFQMVVSQLPNTGVALGMGAAGAAAGSVIPGVGTAIGGIGGFLTGLFAANTALEIGGKAQEKARDNTFTNQERSEALSEGVTKGAVITAVDAVTLGASKWLLGTANRAVETATVRSLQEAGVDTTKAVASIKEAQRVALEATASQGRAASTAAIEKATYETMVREGLTDPAVMAAVRNAQKTAMDSVNTLGKKVGRGTTAVGLETAGEGVGEYLGELAATGKASPTEAVMEALSGLSMSLGELAGVATINKPGTLTSATNIAPPGKTQDTSGNGTQAPLGSENLDNLTGNVTEVDDAKAQDIKSYFKAALSRNPDGVLNVMAAIYAQEKLADPKATAQTNETIKAIEESATRLGIFELMMGRIGDFKTPTEAELAGEQILSDSPQFREIFVDRLMQMANTLPANTSPKRENRMATPSERTLSEEEVMNAAIPDEGSSSGEPANSAHGQNMANVSAAENPGQAAAQIINKSVLSNDLTFINGWKEIGSDRYNVTSYDSPDGKQKAFTHPELPGVVFGNRDDLFNAFALLDAAGDARKKQIAAKANPPQVDLSQEDLSENKYMDVFNRAAADKAAPSDMDLLGEPADQQAPPAETKVDVAKKNLDDALYNLWDVASDASNTKMNIMGKRFTAKDLPKAIQKVMEALVKLGYVKLADISEELLKRMKASERWKDLVDKVTPDMLRNAYNKLADFKGKQSPDEVRKKTVTELTRDLPKVIQNIIENGDDLRSESESRIDPATGQPYLLVVSPGKQSVKQGDKKLDDMQILLKRRLLNKPEWADLADKLSPAMVKQAYAQATKAMAKVDENEQTGSYKKVERKPKEEVAETIVEYTPKKRTAAEEMKAELVLQIKNIYKKNTNAAYYDGILQRIHSEIDSLSKQIFNLNVMYVGKDMFVRREDGSIGMEGQLASTGRIGDDQGAYFQLENEAVFENPDSKAALLARKRMLEIELRNAQADKVSKQAQKGKLAIRATRREIEDAIADAVKNGLPEADKQEIGREWAGGIDNYLTLGRIAKAEKQSQARQEEKDFLEQTNKSVEEAEMPSDYEFSLGISRDIRTGKVDVNEAINLVDEAARRNELESKKKTVSQVLTELVADYGLLKDQIKGERMLNDIINWASKAKKEGLLRFDDFVDIFHSNNLDVPHEVVKMGEAAANRSLLDFMADNKFDPTFRYYWLRSMDRVVRFNPSSLDSSQFTSLERDLYQEWKAQTSSVNNRRKTVADDQDNVLAYDNLLFRNYSLEDMRNTENIPINERMRLKELYPDLVEAFFGDIQFAIRMGISERTSFGRNALAAMNREDRIEYNNWLDRQVKMVDDSHKRLERAKYFDKLAQFKHIGEDDYQALYTMIARDSVANLPMIFDMAQKMELYAIRGESVNPETGEIGKIESESARDIRKRLEDIKAKSGKVEITSAQNENENQAFEDNVLSAYVRSQMDIKGVSDASIGRDPMFDFNTYKDAVEGRFTSYEEGSGEQNTSNMDDESAQDQMMYGMDVSMRDDYSKSFDDVNKKEDGRDSEGGEDNVRARQGQYAGFLSTAMVMNYVNQITKNWKNAPNIVVLQNHLQLPEGIREEVSRKLQSGMGAKGLFDGASGTLYLFSNYISSLDDAQFTLFHEAYGHLGLRLMFGKDFDTFLENMYKSSPAVRLDADARMGKGVGRLEAIEETLADFAGENKETGVVKEFIGKIISSLRKIGLDRVANYLGGFTDAELSYSLKAARAYAENAGGYSPLVGGPTDIRLSDERPPYEIFAKMGMNTTGYARYDPLTGQYNVFVSLSGKSDIRQGSKMLIMNSLDDVVDYLSKLGKLERRVRSGFYRDDKLPSDFVRFLNSQQMGFFKRNFETFLRSTQNQYLPVFRLVEQMENYKGVNRLTGDIDLRKFLRTIERQSGVAVEDFGREYVIPIMDMLAQAEKSKGAFTEGASNVYEMLNKFLLAQTAEERNKQVNKRNNLEFAGSGMASASSVLADPAKHPVDTAQKILDFVATQPYAAQFLAIGKKLDDMSDAKLDGQVKSGLLSQKEADAWRGAYKSYRNLSGINTELDEDYTNDPSLNIGRKFNVKGKDKYALGRGDEAPDILARTLLGAEAAIIRGNKNLIAQRVLAFFETNYDSNFVSINEQARVKQISADGFVETVEKQNYINQPDVMVAKVRGIPVTIRFKDAGYNSIAEAIHGKSDPQSEHPIRHIMQLMGRTTGALITKYNPFWIPVNFVRDVQTLFLNAGVNGTIGWGMAGEMGKALLPAIGTAMRVALMDMRVTSDAGKAAKATLIKMMGKPNAEMLAHYQEGRQAGAFTSFINHKNLEDQIIEINEAINGKSAIGKVEGFFKFWELVTLPVEIAPRLAAYATLKRNGRTTLDSADYAGSVTVDFNARGANEWLRAAYLFFNPAVQGTAQLVKLAKENPARFGAVAAGLMSLGFLTSMLGRMQGDDDDEKRRRKESGLSVLDEIPEYKRATSIILFPNVRGGAIPIAYGWNAFFAAGVFAADSIVGNTPVSVSAKRTLQAAFEAFSPVGGSGFDMLKVASDPLTQVTALVMPTVGAPLAQWMTNKNRYGGPLYPDSQFAGTKGDSDVTRAFSSVNPISRWMAENLQSATGGNRFNKEGIDINPALIDHLSASYLPGLITEVYKGAGVVVRKSQGLEVARDKEPLFDRFSAYASESFDAAAFRRVADKVDAVYGELENTPSRDPRHAQILKLHPEIGLMKTIINAAGQDLREVRKDIREAEEMAYILRKDGQIDRANKMDADAVTLRNKSKVYEKQLFNKVVVQATKSGFSNEVYSD